MKTALILGLLLLTAALALPFAAAETPSPLTPPADAAGTCIIITPGAIPPITIDLFACLPAGP